MADTRSPDTSLVGVPADGEATSGGVDDDVPWLSAEQQREWRSMMAMTMRLQVALDAQLKRDSGLNMFEYHVLVALGHDAERGLPMTELAAVALGSISRLSHAVSRLERDGWVQRFACAEAGRRTSVRLTPAGLRKLQAAAPDHVREARRLVVDALTPEQLAALGDASRTVLRVIDPEVAERFDGGPVA